MVLTHKERVLNTIRGKKVDRLPSDIWLSNRAIEKFINKIQVSKDELMSLLDNHLVMVYNLDNHKSWDERDSLELALRYNYFHLDAGGNVIYDSWGVGWDISHEGIYEVYHPLSNLTNLKDFKMPDPKDPHLFDLAKLTADKYMREYCITGIQDLTLFERACALRGFNNFLIDMKLNRSFAEELLDIITHYQIELAKRFVEIGVDLILTGGDYGTQKDLIMSVEDWKHYEMPRLKKIWDIYKRAGIPIIHHSCGNIIKVIPFLIEMGMDVLNPVQHVMQPLELKRRFDKKIIFFGGIDTQNMIPLGRPEEIEEEVKNYINALGKDGGYIIGPDQCLMSDVPFENILALVDAIKKYAHLSFN